MIRCRDCGFEIPPEARYCAGCAALISSHQSGETRTIDFQKTPPPYTGQLAPGALLGGRYTILDLAGRGGMGEVYRTRDNKLDQVVALKILPESLRRNAAALARLRQEVRIARQVSHPNVCRVYDIGEADGFQFLTMEFIDGEDLARLLKRIGRFPHDKGVEIARRLCAALSAAHGRGVLHRDLKPANIMLNAAGHVMITDFGLAALAEQLKGAEARSGTPAYMSPEQVEGRQLSVRSDIYSLGIVLYEIFAGRRPFEGENRRHLTAPSSVVKDLDPAVERVILRCLSEDPESRPPSVMAVAAGLPGGDPLEMALAAGETPSPELVAACGAESGISVRAAVWCLTATLVMLALMVAIGSRPQVLARSQSELPPDSLALKARELAAVAGYPERPPGHAMGFLYDTEQIRRLEQQGWGAPEFSRPSPVRFWYRESPRLLAGFEMKGVNWSDPPANLPGMISVQMDTAGRLMLFRAVPAEAATPADPREWWNVFLSAAGLDLTSIRESPPQILPPTFADSRKAWTGCYQGRPQAKVRVESAGLGGRPVYFRIIPAWDTITVDPAQLDVVFRNATRPYTNFYSGAPLAIVSVLIMIGLGIAWANLRSGRGDRRGAFRVAACVGALWTLYGHSLGFGQIGAAPERSWIITAHAIYMAALSWVSYIALEPWVRRNWPTSMISWNRLIYGGIRDPLVGRDILVGILAGLGYAAARFAISPFALGSPVAIGLGGTAGLMAVCIAGAIAFAMFCAAVLAFALAAFGRRWAAFGLAIGLSFVLVFVASNPGRSAPLPVVAFNVLYSVVTMTVLFRFGVLAGVANMVATSLLYGFPMGFDLNAWYQDTGRICVLLLAGLSVYCYHAALAGRRVFRDPLG